MPFGTQNSVAQTDQVRDQNPEQTIPTKTAAAPGPDSPLELPARDWKATIKRALKEIKDDRITMAAAGMAFYFFLAIFPALIAAVGLLDLLNAEPVLLASITDTIKSTLPGSAGTLLIDAVASAQEASEGASLVAALLGIAVALWSATSGMVALQIGLDIAYDVPQERKFIGKRLVALALIVAVGVLGGVPSPFFAPDGVIWSVIGWIVTFASVSVLFAILYYLGPNREKPNWKWVSPGGLLGAAIWILVSLGFSYYLSNFAQYADTYGELAGVVVLIFWLYLSALAILVGGELNAELERQTAKRSGRI